MYDERVNDVSAFVLAGGKSTRMGSDKALVMVEGRTLLSSALEVARALTPHVQIVGDPAKYSPFAPVVADIFPGCGPLAGIHAALRSSQTEWNVILAVDTPFVSPALLNYLLTRAMSSPAIVTVPSSPAGLEPLCAVYRREFAALAEKSLREGKYKIDRLFDRIKITVISQEDLQAEGFDARLFRNLNTQRDIASLHERSEP